MIYFEAPYLTIHWDEETQCVIMEWKAFTYGEDYKTGVNKGVELFKQQKATRWLSNMQNMRVLEKPDQQWTMEVWLPALIEAGLEKLAMVVPTSALAKMSLRAMSQQSTGIKIQAKQFDNFEEAKKWLRS